MQPRPAWWCMLIVMLLLSVPLKGDGQQTDVDDEGPTRILFVFDASNSMLSLIHISEPTRPY